jgi:hypothetical protein
MNCEVVGCEFVVAGCHTPTLLDLVEEPFHEIATAIETRAEAARLLAVRFGRMFAQAPC